MRARTLMRISIFFFGGGGGGRWGWVLNRSLHIFLHKKLKIVIPFGSYSNCCNVLYD